VLAIPSLCPPSDPAGHSLKRSRPGAPRNINNCAALPIQGLRLPLQACEIDLLLLHEAAVAEEDRSPIDDGLGPLPFDVNKPGHADGREPLGALDDGQTRVGNPNPARQPRRRLRERCQLLSAAPWSRCPSYQK
jgi:hypothetical protein